MCVNTSQCSYLIFVPLVHAICFSLLWYRFHVRWRVHVPAVVFCRVQFFIDQTYVFSINLNCLPLTFWAAKLCSSEENRWETIIDRSLRRQICSPSPLTYLSVVCSYGFETLDGSSHGPSIKNNKWPVIERFFEALTGPKNKACQLNETVEVAGAKGHHVENSNYSTCEFTFRLVLCLYSRSFTLFMLKSFN